MNKNNVDYNNKNSSHVIAQIEKEIKVALEEIPKYDDIDVIEIDLPPINDKKHEKILETIHNIFQAERINDRLFIKFDVNGNEFRPDVGGWNQWSTRRHLSLMWHSIGLRIVSMSLNKIEYVQPYCPNTEFVLIVITFGISPFQANLNPGIISVAVISPRTDHPSRAPYIGHWAVGAIFDAVQWHKMRWNEHIILGCGGASTLMIYLLSCCKYLASQFNNNQFGYIAI
ncbi:18007_t:CDS:2 [Entrophospora sp. SA101]|nr:18007_t:CDS:2 [Entrophospora sp. SA101]